MSTDKLKRSIQNAENYRNKKVRLEVENDIIAVEASETKKAAAFEASLKRSIQNAENYRNKKARL